MELPDSHIEVLQLLAGAHDDLEIDPEVVDDLRKRGDGDAEDARTHRYGCAICGEG